LASPDVLGQVGLDRQDGQLLNQEARQDIYHEIIEDQTTEGFYDILCGEQFGQQVPEGKPEEESAGQQVEGEKSDDKLCGEVLAGASAAPECLPLMGEECKDHLTR